MLGFGYKGHFTAKIHYANIWKKFLNLKYLFRMPKPCKEPGCPLPIWGGGYCQRHQFKRGKIRSFKRSPIRTQSVKRKAQNSQYSQEITGFLNEHKWCAIFPQLRSTQVHHKKHRENDRLLDKHFWLAVSDQGHKYIHANPAISYEKGWLIKG